MSAFLSACSCLCDASVTRPEQRHRAPASALALALAWIDRPDEDAPNPPGAVEGMYVGEDTYIAVHGLCLSGDPGEVARGTESKLRLSAGAERFANSAVSDLQFSQRARSFVSLGLVSRQSQRR